ncbi:hypothetical protein DIPPA_01774 [Diplonema papillatum]|nr:hypothetical protein DIPPA_01774 [Diplonema papillatum]
MQSNAAAAWQASVFTGPSLGSYLPVNRHRIHGQESSKNFSIERSRVVVRGGKKMKVPVALTERPDWNPCGGRSAKQPVLNDWSDLNHIQQTCEKLVNSKHVETRLHAAFAVARCSQVKENRELLSLTPGVIEALAYTLKHAEPSESGRRCQLHCLTVLHNVLLESQKADVFIGHDDGILSGILRCLNQSDLPLQELAITCLDFLSISETNQPVLCFKAGLLDSVVNLLKTTNSGYAVYHALHTLTYLTTCRRTHHAMSRHDGVLEVLLSTLSAHEDDPARCQQGLVALCNLMSMPENAAVIQMKYRLVDIVEMATRQTVDQGVVAYCNEVLQRIQPEFVHSENSDFVGEAFSAELEFGSKDAAANHAQRTLTPPHSQSTQASRVKKPFGVLPHNIMTTEGQHPLNFSFDSFSDGTPPTKQSSVYSVSQAKVPRQGILRTPDKRMEGAAAMRSDKKRLHFDLGDELRTDTAATASKHLGPASPLPDNVWRDEDGKPLSASDPFDIKWQTMRNSVAHRDTSNSPAAFDTSRVPGLSQSSIDSQNVSPVRHRADQSAGEAQTLALLDRYEAELYATMAEIEKDSSQSPFRFDTKPRPPLPPIARHPSSSGRPTLPPIDADDDRLRSHMHTSRFTGRHGVGTFAGRSEPSPSGASDMWSVSGESDI